MSRSPDLPIAGHDAAVCRVWFNNVEIVTAEKVGMETTTYVRNIYKYYVTYRLLIEAEQAKQRAIEQAAGL